MRKFLKNSILFLIICLITGEIVVRVSHAVTDIPQRVIDEEGIQKYKPNQIGYWKGGKHTWKINEYGWPGTPPVEFNELVLIIGDSFIENFMNPNECHQGELLKRKLSKYNFFEAARSGVSFIEAFEIDKQLDSLEPVNTLIYVNDEDFTESIREISLHSDITQFSITKNKIFKGEMKSPRLKKILYNWKLMYYFYNRFPISFSFEKDKPKEKKQASTNNNHSIIKLLDYVSANYDISNKTLVFHPNSDYEIIEACKTVGFNVIVLNSKNDTSWTFDYDSHWTCYGHKKVAEQVALSLKKILK